jgi:hypothetical protein
VLLRPLPSLALSRTHVVRSLVAALHRCIHWSALRQAKSYELAYNLACAMLDHMRLWDISAPLRVGMPTWPGDTDFDERRTWVLSADCPVNVSRLVLSSHAGTHADAPAH